MNGFGFTDTMKSLGVERRLYTAGEHKGFLDPFSNVKPAEKAHVQGMLNDIHTEFIESVKSGRGERLVWAGSESIELGLTDAIGDVRSVAKNEIGEEKIVDFTAQQPFLEKLAKSMGAATASFMANFTTLNKVFLF